MNRKSALLDASVALVLLGGNLLLVAPYLRTDFSSQPWNNDYTYIAMARMFRDQPWSWNALQYCGSPFAYVYPPLFQVLMAALPISLGRSFHIASSLGFALAPVSLYILGLQLFRARFLAAFAAVAYSVAASPVYFLLPVWGNLTRAMHHAPWGFVTLVAYSEAGHTLAFAVALATLAAAWRGRWKLASFGAAIVFLLNWPGLVGLCMGLAAVAVARRDLRPVAAAGIAYGLAAFWMTPGFFYATSQLNRVVLRHEQSAAPWDARTWAILAAAALLLVLAAWRRTPPEARFLLAWLAISGAVVATFSVAGNYLVPLPHRYVMEFNAALVLAVAWLAGAGKTWRVAIATLLLILGAWAARGFLRHPWRLQPGEGNPRELLAFQISDWLEHHAASARVFAAGELDGALNALSGVAQVGGTRQGVSNFLTIAAQRQVAFGCEEPERAARLDELWLRALDARYAVVHDAHSREYFHWFVQPEAFAGFPVAWTNGAGDTIYRLPPPEPDQAVVVDLGALEHLPRLRATDDLAFLEAYVAWARGKRPARVRWIRPAAAELEADVQSGEAVLVKRNYDRGWRSSASVTRPDPIGFLLIHAPAGRRRLELRFGAAWDVWLARALTLLTLALLAARVPARVVASCAVAPALLAYAVLWATAPGQAAVAEESFRRLRPPIINPGGIVGDAAAVSIYGSNFGSARDRVRVFIAGREARILYHAADLLNVELPAAAGSGAEVRVEVNGCRGNAFLYRSRKED